MARNHDSGEWSRHDLRRGLTRRDLLGAGIGSLIGAAAVGTGRVSSNSFGGPPTNVTEPRSDGSGGTGVVRDLRHATDLLDAGPVRPILDATAFGRPWYPPGADESVAVVSFDATDRVLSAAYLEPDLPVASDYAVVGDVALAALILRDPHCGCKNVYCESSGWWESPCHFERYNTIGEWQRGESPRGLDRYPTRVENDRLLIVLRRTVVGPAPDAGAGSNEPAGPFCIGG